MREKSIHGIVVSKVQIWKPIPLLRPHPGLSSVALQAKQPTSQTFSASIALVYMFVRLQFCPRGTVRVQISLL